LTLEIDSASKAAVAAVEKAGGTLILERPREAAAAEPDAAQAGSDAGADDAAGADA
jgi:hypothetical protein